MKQLFFLLFLATALMACKGITGSGNIITERRDVGHFSGISSSGSIDIEVVNGPSETVEVEADDNALKYIITEVKGGNLDVHYKSNMSFMNIHTKVIVTAPGFDLLSVKGSGNISSTGRLLQEEKIEIRLNGSGDINAYVDAPEIIASLKGSGSISLRGRTRNFEASLDGSGDIKAKDLKSESTNIEANGSGSAYVFASVFLKARKNGSGDIRYSGHPGKTELNSKGSGALEAED